MGDKLRASIRPRFTLAGFLLAVAGLALGLGLATQLGWVGFVGIWVGTIVLVLAYRLTAREPRHRRAHLYALVGLGLLPFALWCGVLGLLFSGVIGMRPSYETCEGRIGYLVLALHRYSLDHGDFPPPFVADSNGKPMHSWRVLILPYLGENALYQSYNMNEPWDGPNNSKLGLKVPELLRCPSDRDLGDGETRYFYVLRPQPDSPQGRGANAYRKVTLIESGTAGINWLEPRDLSVEEVVRARTGRASQRDRPLHDGGGDGYFERSPPAFHAALDDSTALAIRWDIDDESLRSLLASNGAQELDLGSAVAAPRIWSGVWVLTAAEVAFLALVIARRVRLVRRFDREAPHG
jgi:hypothetical protein